MDDPGNGLLVLPSILVIPLTDQIMNAAYAIAPAKKKAAYDPLRA